MSSELNLGFPRRSQVVVRYGDDDPVALPFVNPVRERDHADIRWYIETYAAHSLGDPDDKEAARIAELLKDVGGRLFRAVFGAPEALQLWFRFRDAREAGRLLTVSAMDAEVLRLPWELLRDPSQGGGFLFRERPSVSIRRRVQGALGGRAAFRAGAKDALHLLFVVSRPDGSGFLDPRADARAVLDAIDAKAGGRITVEFLRPPTFNGLMERLNDGSLPRVDIIHFDGHGVFDADGSLIRRMLAQSERGGGAGAGSALLRHSATDAGEPNTGYLLFETGGHEIDFISARELGENLYQHEVALVILSACQSATVAGKGAGDGGAGTPGASAASGEGAGGGAGEEAVDRPMGSVAARLTATGIPAVLAMTHSVLVPTTRALFGEFYKHVADGRGLGEALDLARAFVANNPEKYEVQRGTERVPLKLYDWFLPALYQQGSDVALLRRAPAGAAPAAAVRPAVRTNVPRPLESGFVGRRRDLWQIERWLSGAARRVTVSGFGGQGKTVLAQEAARWLTRTGMFDAAVFVGYAQLASADAVRAAITEIGSVLGQSLPDAGSVTAALSATPTLVILDNLEALADGPLRELLTAAEAWSEAGRSRVLCTTRRPDDAHPAFGSAGTLLHRRIQLDGLGSRRAPDDGLELFARLYRMPPEPSIARPSREALIDLFDRVRFHPLSIRVLTQQLKTRPAQELVTRLGELLAADTGGASATDTPAALVASLRLSLDRLEPAARAVLPRLGVFKGGAFEDDLMAVTGLGDPAASRRGELRSMLEAADRGDVEAMVRADLAARGRSVDGPLPEAVLEAARAEVPAVVEKLRARLAALGPAPAGEQLWPSLRRALEAAALIECEQVPSVRHPFVRFHPTLAPMLWGELAETDRASLSEAFRTRYAIVAAYLYDEDDRQASHAREIARREVLNLLHAVALAMDAEDPGVAALGERVTFFLRVLGLTKEAEALIGRLRRKASERGSEAWVLAHSAHAERLIETGRPDEADDILLDVIDAIGPAPSHARALAHSRLARCRTRQGRYGDAERLLGEALGVCDALAGDAPEIKLLRRRCTSELGNVLLSQERFGEARECYERSRVLAGELGDERGIAVCTGQLGSVALREGNYAEAERAYLETIEAFTRLNEPSGLATIWHQLGSLYGRIPLLEQAESCLRESARIEESLGNLHGAAQSWAYLATVMRRAGNESGAETWFRKAIEAFRAVQNPYGEAAVNFQLASMLAPRPEGRGEARELLLRTIELERGQDLEATQTWTTHDLLAHVDEALLRETSDPDVAERLRAERARAQQQARAARLAYVRSTAEVRKHLPLIARVVLAATSPAESLAMEPKLEEVLGARERNGWVKLVGAMRRIVAGERDEQAIVAGLDSEDSVLVNATLHAIADPSWLTDLAAGANAPAPSGPHLS